MSWHKADIGLRDVNVSFGGKANMAPVYGNVCFCKAEINTQITAMTGFTTFAD
jgi:hypothetical protein